MLIELRVSNFVLIDRLALTVPSGFVALTGETGAGKSLLIDAIGLLLGDRAGADHIRAGCDEATVEAHFSLSAGHPVLKRLAETDIVAADDTDVIVRRVLSRSGRGRCYVNGRLAAASELQHFAGTLVDIHGQHEQQSLLHPTTQLEALDRFGHLDSLRADYIAQYEVWQAQSHRLTTLRAEAEAHREREELLRYQAQEIRDAVIQPHEDETLAERCTRLGQSERVRQLSESAYDLLYAGEGAAVERVTQACRGLEDLAGIDAAVQPWAAQLSQARVLLQDVAEEVRHYREQIEDDPALLEQLESRAARLESLKKKYGGSLEAVRAKGAELDRWLAQLDGNDGEMAELVRAVTQAEAELARVADRLTAARKAAAARLEQALKQELAALSLQRATVRLSLGTLAGPERYGPYGQDRAELLFSANSGEALQPLARVASGGELSRAMLALKTICADDEGVPVLVFDEIDAGVGGAVATAIGIRLRALSRHHQVLCVTHLPQVAAQADRQFLVEKSVQGARTVTNVRELSGEDRTAAVAAMLGGQGDSLTMRRAAEELLGEREKPSSKVVSPSGEDARTGKAERDSKKTRPKPARSGK
ncbi:MAG: DNA repair protein RecN [Nitrospiraceae bacterium]